MVTFSKRLMFVSFVFFIGVCWCVRVQSLLVFPFFEILSKHLQVRFLSDSSLHRVGLSGLRQNLKIVLIMKFYKNKT